jgi:hypothetical protein
MSETDLIPVPRELLEWLISAATGWAWKAGNPKDELAKIAQAEALLKGE